MRPSYMVLEIRHLPEWFYSWVSFFASVLQVSVENAESRLGVGDLALDSDPRSIVSRHVCEGVAKNVVANIGKFVKPELPTISKFRPLPSPDSISQSKSIT